MIVSDKVKVYFGSREQQARFLVSPLADATWDAICAEMTGPFSTKECSRRIKPYFWGVAEKTLLSHVYAVLNNALLAQDAENPCLARHGTRWQLLDVTY